MKRVIIAYVPVLHKGYLQLFDKYIDDPIYIFGPELILRFDHLRKDIRSIDPYKICSALQGIYKSRSIYVLSEYSLAPLVGSQIHVITPDEDISHELYDQGLLGNNVTFENIFLRYDRKRSESEFEVNPDRTVGVTDLDRELMKRAYKESEKSSDWWRQVGALIVSPDGSVLLVTHNHHVPTPDNPYILGDPRGNYKKGVNIELGTALHAEKGLICEAARRGIALEGTSLYVTTFPCPPCAKAVAYCGIKKLYYHTGYAMVDGESILKENTVEIIQVLL